MGSTWPSIGIHFHVLFWRNVVKQSGSTYLRTFLCHVLKSNNTAKIKVGKFLSSMSFKIVFNVLTPFLTIQILDYNLVVTLQTSSLGSSQLSKWPCWKPKGSWKRDFPHCTLRKGCCWNKWQPLQLQSENKVLNKGFLWLIYVSSVNYRLFIHVSRLRPLLGNWLTSPYTYLTDFSVAWITHALISGVFGQKFP